MSDIKTPRFIIIDDDSINNHICTKYIDLVFPGALIKAFTNPQKALDFIASGQAEPIPETVLLLDINMPILNGWEVLERFEQFPDELKKCYSIYILSSSVAQEDKNKASDNPLVAGFIEKPLSIPELKKIFASYGI